MTNPATIISFAAIFAGLGLIGAGASLPAASLLVLGVFLGSALWWLGLTGGVAALRDRMGADALRRANRFSVVLIGAFGVAALISGVTHSG